jgi:hypothetical protein
VGAEEKIEVDVPRKAQVTSDAAQLPLDLSIATSSIWVLVSTPRLARTTAPSVVRVVTNTRLP